MIQFLALVILLLALALAVGRWAADRLIDGLADWVMKKGGGR